MKRPPRYRRFAIFTGAALLVCAGMLTGMLFALQKHLGVGNWTEYLGGSERAALQNASNPVPDDPANDPNLAIPGIAVEPGQRMNSQGLKFISYGGSVSDGRLLGISPLDIVASAWEDQGMKLERDGDRLTARIPGGDTYVASFNAAHPNRVSLLHFQTGTNAPFGQSAVEWPAQYAGLFPTLPDSMHVMEHGRPGTPGYSLLLASPADPVTSFKIFRGELEKRGWETFDDTMAAAFDQASDRKLKMLDSLALGYSHRQAPFGCQLVVNEDRTRPGESMVMLSLF